MIPTDGTGSFGPMRFVGRAGFSGGGCGPQCHRLVLHPGDPREQVVRRTRTGRGGSLYSHRRCRELERANLDVFFWGTILGNLQLMVLS